jgi:hypothetical protein
VRVAHAANYFLSGRIRALTSLVLPNTSDMGIAIARRPAKLWEQYQPVGLLCGSHINYWLPLCPSDPGGLGLQKFWQRTNTDDISKCVQYVCSGRGYCLCEYS